ncbi:FkbM family methyltransferase [Microcoleus sp. LEGE 07076]|uniref:FkbM family methyltransferase n=1 Tax=Microcoleus sp. LEGE 07076 TaxID=915322 RepID=UPI00187FE66E|nr:FkbM family methyltransferase [Microcoleus sp. LEGE 07076]MBE9183336.1 FkbM family methyltransferase [Microcoleus sp. LEGE 07076]
MFQELLSEIAIFNENSFVLVDIGASGEPHRIWQEIALFSYYIGFDPDSRELNEENSWNFQKFTIIKKIVTDDSSSQVKFVLTSYPYCSSTLQPKFENCQQYSFTETFDVESYVELPATRLDEVIRELKIHGIDWLKLDSQGRDLDLFLSIDKSVRDRILAIDVEPGILAFYEGENTFDLVHKSLIEEGFWLSSVNFQSFPRVMQSTRKALSSQLDRQQIERLPGSPTAAEARYFRTLDHLKLVDSSLRDYVSLWAFALLDGKVGFALDIALHIADSYGTDSVGDALLDKTIELAKDHK